MKKKRYKNLKIEKTDTNILEKFLNLYIESFYS